MWSAWSGHALRLKWLEVYTHAHTHQMQPECTHHADSCPISPMTTTTTSTHAVLLHRGFGTILKYCHCCALLFIYFDISKWCKCLTQGTCNNILFFTSTGFFTSISSTLDSPLISWNGPFNRYRSTGQNFPSL